MKETVGGQQQQQQQQQHQQQQQQQEQQQEQQEQQAGGRRRTRSRRGKGRKGRKGRGGYLMNVIGSAALLGATQLSKEKAGYGFAGRNGYYRKTKRRGSRRSKGSRRR